MARSWFRPMLSTVLVYAHYDVMPAGAARLMEDDPFEPEIRDGRIGHVEPTIRAEYDSGERFRIALREGLLGCNVEIYIWRRRRDRIAQSGVVLHGTKGELLKADVILVSDTSMVGKETPSLTTGLRGLAYWEIEVTGPNRDLHSGHFGRAVANPSICCMADGRHHPMPTDAYHPSFLWRWRMFCSRARDDRPIPFDEAA